MRIKKTLHANKSSYYDRDTVYDLINNISSVRSKSDVVISENTQKEISGYMDKVYQSNRKHKLKKMPIFRAGDTVRFGLETNEDEKTIIENIEGVVISRSGEGPSARFTIRKIGANSVGVERIFPLFSDNLISFDVVKRKRVRRANLHYIRTEGSKVSRLKQINS